MNADLIRRHRWRILIAALVVQVTISVVTQGFPALVPFAKVDLNLTTAGVGVFASLQNLGTMIALLPAGWTVDTLGERRVLVTGGLATGGATLLAAAAPSFALLLPVLILIGFAGATPTPAGSSAIMSAFAVKDRAFVVSLRQTGIPIGGAVAALLLPIVAASRGWRDALVVAAVLAAAGAALAFLLMRGAARIDSSVERARFNLASVRRSVTHDATYIGLAGVFLTAGQFVLVSYIALYLIETAHMSFAVGSIFLVAANVGGVAGRVAWGVISDRLFNGVRRTPLILVSLSSAIGFVILALLPVTAPFAVLVLVVVLLGAAAIGWNGLYITLLSEVATPDARGRSVAYGMTLTQIGIFTGPVAFGLIVDSLGSYRVAWLAVGAAMLVATVLTAQIRERRSALALSQAQ